MPNASTDDNSGDDEDEWENADLPMALAQAAPSAVKDDCGDDYAAMGEEDDVAGDGYWDDAHGAKTTSCTISEKSNATASSSLSCPHADSGGGSTGEPMIIVDMTDLSNGAIHSRFDRTSVNDPPAASNLRRNVERNYARYANDASLLASRTVIPCGSSVWRPALLDLRLEKSGHYFAPIFPPKKP